MTNSHLKTTVEPNADVPQTMVSVQRIAM